MLDIPRRHVRALLYYLAAQWEPASRAKICLLFWPDHSERDSRRNLTRVLTHLRRALPSPEALVTDEELVYLDEQFFHCDVVELCKFTSGQRQANHLVKVLDLYRGPFLDGFYLPDCLEYENWVAQQRANLEFKFLDVLSWLIDNKTEEKDYHAAIVCITLLFLGIIPLLSPFNYTAYNTNIFSANHYYTRPFVHQWFEARYSPAVVILLTGLALLVMQLTPRKTLHPLARLLFCAGAGFFGFGLFRVTLGMVYAEALVWATFWEELTELMFVGAVIYILWVFRSTLLPGFDIPKVLKQILH